MPILRATGREQRACSRPPASSPKWTPYVRRHVETLSRPPGRSCGRCEGRKLPPWKRGWLVRPGRGLRPSPTLRIPLRGVRLACCRSIPTSQLCQATASPSANGDMGNYQAVVFNPKGAIPNLHRGSWGKDSNTDNPLLLYAPSENGHAVPNLLPVGAWKFLRW